MLIYIYVIFYISVPQFTGADIDATGVNFSTSIPLHMALDPTAQILLATSMNGAPLPPDHGYPLRVVVPGAPAVRSVKWLREYMSEDTREPKKIGPSSRIFKSCS